MPMGDLIKRFPGNTTNRLFLFLFPLGCCSEDVLKINLFPKALNSLLHGYIEIFFQYVTQRVTGSFIPSFIYLQTFLEHLLCP